MNIEGGVFHKGALLPLFFAEHKKKCILFRIVLKKTGQEQ